MKTDAKHRHIILLLSFFFPPPLETEKANGVNAYEITSSLSQCTEVRSKVTLCRGPYINAKSPVIMDTHQEFGQLGCRYLLLSTS